MFGDDDLLGDLTVLIGIISALAGYLGTWWKDRQDREEVRGAADRLARRERVERQLKDLFGPLRMLDIACFQAVTPMATLYGAPEATAGNVPKAIEYLAEKAAEDPASNMAYDYRFLIRNRMLVNLQKMSDVVQTNGHLFDGFVPDWVFKLEAYYAQWRLIVRTWDVLYDVGLKRDKTISELSGSKSFKTLCEETNGKPTKEDFQAFLADKGICRARESGKEYRNYPANPYPYKMVLYVASEYGRLKKYQDALLGKREDRVDEGLEFNESMGFTEEEYLDLFGSRFKKSASASKRKEGIDSRRALASTLEQISGNGVGLSNTASPATTESPLQQRGLH